MKIFFKRLFEFIKITKAKKILDISCGEGYITSLINKSFNVEIIGYDLEEEAIKNARKLNPAIKFKIGSIEDIKEKDKGGNIGSGFFCKDIGVYPSIL